MKIKKVLIVEDEPHIRRIGELSLRGVGKWEVVLASSGVEGLDRAASEQPDVILLDVMMPGMDGPTMLAELRAHSNTAMIPVIFITAKVETHEVERYLSLGAVGVISKPFDPMKLPREIEQILERSNDPLSGP
jgi:CheY-like chemotaxis protein